jgi:hypothetical protein
MGLNELLGNTLSSVSEDNILLSWSIFHEKDGHISMKIRFEPKGDAVKREAETHYKRKPLRQVQRDRERSRAWRAQSVASKEHRPAAHLEHKPTPRGDVSTEVSGAQTRSMVKKSTKSDTPEIPRHDPTSADNDDAQQLYSDTVNTVAKDNLIEDDNMCVSPHVDKLLTPFVLDSHMSEVQCSVICDPLPLEDCERNDIVINDVKSDASGEVCDNDDDSTSTAIDLPKFCLLCWWYDGLNTGSCPEHG